VDEHWKKRPAYFFFDKTDKLYRQSTLNFKAAYENEQFKVFKIN
jgi:hypothetical protein